MIANKPMARAADLLDVRDKIKAYIVTAKGLAADGLSVADFAELVVGLLRIVIDTLDTVPAEGPDKKAWAMSAVGLLFDEVADKVVPVWAWPVWMIVRAPVRQLVLLAAGGAIEQLLPLVRMVK